MPTVVPSILGLSPLAEAAIFAALITLWWWSVRDKVVLLKVQGRPIINAMIDGARNTLPVAMACAAAGIIIGITILTGFGIIFTQWVVVISKDILLVALILTAIAGIVLGMGLPTTPSYILMAALLIPALVKMGVVTPAAHMFAFYFAILSAITPPIAFAVFAAAGLAKANIWNAGWAAMRVGAAGFIVPFMFVYDPALLMIGTGRDHLAFRPVRAGIGMLAAGLHGYLFDRCRCGNAAWRSSPRSCWWFPLSGRTRRPGRDGSAARVQLAGSRSPPARGPVRAADRARLTDSREGGGWTKDVAAAGRNA